MAWNAVVAGGAKQTAAPSGFAGLVTNYSPTELARVQSNDQLAGDAQLSANQSTYANSLTGLAKNTVIDLGHRALSVPVDFAKSLYETWAGTPGKIAEDVQAGASDIAGGSVVKGIAKSGLRTAGDAAIAVFAPVSSAVGAALTATGGQKLLDNTGKVIADTTGITDLPAFQKFAMTHPNAGPDFDRLLSLGFAGAEKGTIDPARMTQESGALAQKLVGSPDAVSSGARAASEVRFPTVTDESTPSEVNITRPEPTGFSSVVERAPDTASTQAPEATTASTGDTQPTTVSTDRPASAAPADESTPVPNTRAMTLEKAAIEKKLVDSLGDLPTHNRMDMAKQASDAADFIEKSPDFALRVARGDELPPSHLLAESVYTALEVKAVREGDVATIQELANSKVPTVAGQSLKALDSADPNSPVKILRDIQAAREAKSEKTTKTPVTKQRAVEVQSIHKEIMAATSKRPTWDEFIETITCGYG